MYVASKGIISKTAKVEALDQLYYRRADHGGTPLFVELRNNRHGSKADGVCCLDSWSWRLGKMILCVPCGTV